MVLIAGYPDHMVFSEFRRRFDVLAPHLTKKLGRNYIVKDEKRVSGERDNALQAFGKMRQNLALISGFCATVTEK